MLVFSHGVSLALLDLLERLHGAVQRMPMVSPEFGICAFEGGVAEGLWLFDALEKSVNRHFKGRVFDEGGVVYPFLCAFLDWLCWDEFFDSAHSQPS